MTVSSTPPSVKGERQSALARLDRYLREVDAVILSRQDPVTGLLPASTAVNAHGDYTDAWVRDNVYSILAAWGLALAYRRLDEGDDRAYRLEQSTVKLMRGLLIAMMRQADRVERFKLSLDPIDALHAKYDTRSGEAVVGDSDWGHLQLDATSLFLLMLAQMTASGLRIVFTIDEVNLVQNLVHYISRAYRIPDYGIWERGNKINSGQRELNASSIGMAKAALEAMSGFDLFGDRGSQSAQVHVVPDDIARCRDSLEALLPRESGSKEVDAAVLSVIGFPAFAVEDRDLMERTQTDIVAKLQGGYGCKRFLLDGHQTVLEDSERLHYEADELQRFAHIESEWPLFFTYLMLNAEFAGDRASAADYRQRLDRLTVTRDGHRLLPELYFVDRERVDAEKAAPGSQPRRPNENLPLVWAQSLYLLGSLVQDGLLYTADLDPLGRRLRVGRQRDPRVQVALIAQDAEVQRLLQEHRIPSETLDAIRPIQVRQADELMQAYAWLGYNRKLKLSGRTARRMRALSTSRVYQLAGERMLFLPQFLSQQEFYLGLDEYLLSDELARTLRYIARHWDLPGRPLVALRIDHGMLGDRDADALLAVVEKLQAGEFSGVRVRVAPLAQHLPTAARERIDYLHDFRFPVATLQDEPPPPRRLPFDPEQSRPLSLAELARWDQDDSDQPLLDRLPQTANLWEQLELLRSLHFRLGLDADTGLGDDAPVTVGMLLEEVYQRAAEQRYWALVRRAAGLLDKASPRLVDAVTEILLHQKLLGLGRSYSRRSTLFRPAGRESIIGMIREFVGDDERERILTQEIILVLASLLTIEPQLFKGMLTLRVGHLMLLLTTHLDQNLPPDQAMDALMELPPHRLADLVKEVLAHFQESESTLLSLEGLHCRDSAGDFTRPVFDRDTDPVIESSGGDSFDDWRAWRDHQGVVGRLPASFFTGVWSLLEHSTGVVIGDKLNRKRRLDSREMLGGMTAGERNFALRVEHLLNKIQAPAYRQVTIETLSALMVVLGANKDLQIDGDLVVDVIIGHAVRLMWQDQFPGAASRYQEQKPLAWEQFYLAPPHRVANAIVDALLFLLDTDQRPA